MRNIALTPSRETVMGMLRFGLFQKSTAPSCECVNVNVCVSVSQTVCESESTRLELSLYASKRTWLSREAAMLTASSRFKFLQEARKK